MELLRVKVLDILHQLCLFEPNAIFTDRTEIGARWNAWGNGSMGPLAQKFWKPRFRVLAIESWYLPMFGPS